MPILTVVGASTSILGIPASLLATLGGIFGLVGIFGAVTAYFGKSRGDAIIAYQARAIELRDGDIARLEKDNAALGAQRDSQAETIETLKGLAQGSPELVKFAESIDRQTGEFKRLTSALTKHLNRTNK